MEEVPVLTILSLAVLLLLALFMGRLVSKIRVPRVTGYLLTGLLLGPSFSNLLNLPPVLSKISLEKIHIISDLALIFILISIGMCFHGGCLQRWRKRIVIFSLSEILLTAIIVFSFVFVVNILFAQYVIEGFAGGAGSSFYIGLFLGVIGIATAPAATLLVIREYESEGSITDAVTALVGINNFFSIIFFNVIIFFLLAPEKDFLILLLQIVVPIAIGGGIGFLISILAQRVDQLFEYQLLILGGGIAILGVCKLLEYDSLLCSLSCGFVLVNSSPKSDEIFNSLKQFDYVLYVVFFVLAGASLHLENLSHLGLLGIVYIVARIAGKLLGSKIGAKLGGFSSTEQNWTGIILLSQAGVAIGLCHSLSKMDAPGKEIIITVILGSVVIFELIGPIGIRFGLVHAGEVPLLKLLVKKAPVGSFEGMHQVISYFRNSIGIPEGHKVESAKDILVKHIMRTNVDTMRDDTPFAELLHYIAHSPYDRFPIIDGEGFLVGVIDYSDIRDVIFTPILSNLIVAIDLVKDVGPVTYPDSTLGEVLEIFNNYQDTSYLPVVDRLKSRKLLGIINQNDVLASFRKP